VGPGFWDTIASTVFSVKEIILGGRGFCLDLAFHYLLPSQCFTLYLFDVILTSPYLSTSKNSLYLAESRVAFVPESESSSLSIFHALGVC